MHAVRVFLVVTAAGVALVCPTAAHAFAFKTPGEAAYCGLGFRGDFGCITPNDGFWIRFDGIYRAATNVTVRKGYDRRYRRYHTSLRVLGFGQRWASSDAELVVCVSRATGLTCKHPPSGLTFWLGRNRGYRIYYSTPGYPIRVRPFFRTRTTWCGLLADTLEPANPAIQCWHPATGLIAGVAHDDADGGGVASRSEQAKGHRPRGFRRLGPGGAFVWRCRQVGRRFADGCSTSTGRPVFRCAVANTRVTCRNVRGRGFFVGYRGDFGTF